MPSGLDATPPPPLSRREWVAQHLRARITNGTLAAGDRLVERDLSEELGISRGPVREAILLLEQEGLVVTHPYRGAVVSAVTPAEVTDVLVPVREVIERAAFAAAATAGDDGLLERLDHLVAAMREATSPLDAGRLADLDVQFHETVIEASGQVQALQIWRLVQPRVRAYFVQDAGRHDDPTTVADQHQVLVEAVRSRDPQIARARLSEHVKIHLSG